MQTFTKYTHFSTEKKKGNTLHLLLNNMYLTYIEVPEHEEWWDTLGLQKVLLETVGDVSWLWCTVTNALLLFYYKKGIHTWHVQLKVWIQNSTLPYHLITAISLYGRNSMSIIVVCYLNSVKPVSLGNTSTHERKVLQFQDVFKNVLTCIFSSIH